MLPRFFTTLRSVLNDRLIGTSFLLQIQPMRNTLRKLLVIMAHHDERLPFLPAIGIDDATHQLPVAGIESMKRLEENMIPYYPLGVYKDKGAAK